MIDIDDLASDIATGIYGDDRMSASDLNAALVALDALVAEVERLRAQVADFRLMIDGLETAAHEERAAVVAWLRTRERQIENWPPGGMNEVSLTYSIIADEIERGEHRREEEK